MIDAIPHDVYHTPYSDPFVSVVCRGPTARNPGQGPAPRASGSKRGVEGLAVAGASASIWEFPTIGSKGVFFQVPFFKVPFKGSFNWEHRVI